MTGDPFTSTNPATGETVWRGNAFSADDVDAAVRSARAASSNWINIPLLDRIQILRN